MIHLGKERDDVVARNREDAPLGSVVSVGKEVFSDEVAFMLRLCKCVCHESISSEGRVCVCCCTLT